MLKRELAIFLIVGVLTVIIDFVSYRSLVWISLLSIDLSKAIGFLTGTIFAYFANRFWTFSHNSHGPGSVWRFIVLYVSTLGANVFVNSFSLSLLKDAPASVEVSFLMATAISAVLNFLGMKLFVFNSKTIEASS